MQRVPVFFFFFSPVENGHCVSDNQQDIIYMKNLFIMHFLFCNVNAVCLKQL